MAEQFGTTTQPADQAVVKVDPADLNRAWWIWIF